MTMNEHRAPLAPGEIRTHTVGKLTFRVMHVSGGSFTQASVRAEGQPADVLATSMHEHEAIRAYADTIELAEQVESDRIDALDDADGPSFDASGAFISDTAGLSSTPRVIDADPGVQVEHEAGDSDDDPAELLAIIRDALRRYVPGGGEQCLDRYLAAVERRAPQRATNNGGQPLWIRDGILGANGMARDDWMIAAGWRPLYTLGGPTGA